MSERDRDSHGDAWRQRLAGLGGNEPLDPQATQQAVEALRRSGLLKAPSRRSPASRMLLPAAASVVLVLAGAWLGRATSGSAGSTEPRYALLLVEDSTFRGEREVGADSLVQEYAAWAGNLARRGQLIVGEELADEVMILGPTAGTLGTRQIAGLFIVSAPNRDAALNIARSCPHLRYGGGIVIRPIAST